MKKIYIFILVFFALPSFQVSAQEESEKDIERLQTGKTPGERATAAMRLGSFKTARVLKPLVEALNDEKIMVQKQAINSLGKICDGSEITILIKMVNQNGKLTNEEKQQKVEEFKNLRKECENSVVPQLIQKIKECDNSILTLIQNAKEDDTPKSRVLIKKELNSNKDIKIHAVKALSKIGSASAKDALTEALNDPDPVIRKEAIDGLGNIGSKTSIGDISRVLETDTIRYVKISCVEALGKINDKSCIPPLKKVIEQTKTDPKDIYIRLAACASLKKLGDDSGMPILKEALNHSSESVRIKAIQLLEELKETSVIDIIKKLAINDPSNIVKGIAKDAVKSLETQKKNQY